MPWQLHAIAGATAGRFFPVADAGGTLIGSSDKHADVCLADAGVGRVHCRLEALPDGRLVITDLSGGAGLYVNMVKVETRTLAIGDVIRVGRTDLRLIQAGAEARPAAEPVADAPPPAPLLPPEKLAELSGCLLGHFEIGGLLGQSPYWAVFKAVDRKTEQVVALKVLAAQFPAGQEELRHFIPVMQQALHLRHENLVILQGVGKSGPYTWIAREYVPGESLAEVLARVSSGGRSKAKWQHALRLGRDLGAALAFIHGEGFMHGRLTPRNILVHSEQRHAKLANFLLEQSLYGSALAALEREPHREQDAAYLSPEQCEEGKFVDGLSDLYSLGAVLYARLTGRPPHQATTPEETMEKIRTAAVPRLRQTNPTVPEDFEAIVLRLLERHQEDRYPSAGALLEDLEPFEDSTDPRSGLWKIGQSPSL